MDMLPDFTFLNIYDSILTCFVLSNMEGWTDIQNQYVNSLLINFILESV